MEQNETRLPFDPRKQLAVLGHLVTNDRFFRIAKDRMKHEWFNDPRAGKLFAIQKRFAEKHGRIPSVDELKECPEMVAEPDLGVLNALKGILDKAVLETGNFGLDALRVELTHWMHARAYVEGINKSSDLYNKGKFEEAYSYVADRINEIRTTRFDEEPEIHFENFEEYLAASEQNYGSAISFGLTILDDALVPNNDSQGKGGLYKGDTTIILAPSNVGKTSFMITTIGHAIKRLKRVLFFTHEGRPSDIREKILQTLLGITKEQLFDLYKTDEGRAKLTFVTKMMGEYLTYIPYNRAGMTVEEVMPIIRRRQEQLIAHKGVGYDLIVSDYPAKLSTNKANGGHLQQRHIDAIVYEHFVQIGLELDCHVLAAIQTNRSGSIANREDERLLTMEDVAESWGVMTAATNVISLNRDLQASLKDRLTLYVAKSRSSEVGRAIVARTNYAACLTHGDDLGGTWYRGTSTMSDRIDSLLAKYNNQAIPQADH